MKTNKKLKLNTKKVVILSNEQQDSVQGGTFLTRNCPRTWFEYTCDRRHCNYTTRPECPVEA